LSSFFPSFPLLYIFFEIAAATHRQLININQYVFDNNKLIKRAPCFPYYKKNPVNITPSSSLLFMAPFNINEMK